MFSTDGCTCRHHSLSRPLTARQHYVWLESTVCAPHDPSRTVEGGYILHFVLAQKKQNILYNVTTLHLVSSEGSRTEGHLELLQFVPGFDIGFGGRHVSERVPSLDIDTHNLHS